MRNVLTGLAVAIVVIIGAYGYFEFVQTQLVQTTNVPATNTPIVSSPSVGNVAPEPVTVPVKTLATVQSDPNSFNGQILALTNSERPSQYPLKESIELDTRALARAYQVCQLPWDAHTHDSFYNASNRGESILSSLAVSDASAENLARNFQDASSTNAGFMASQTHRNNIRDTLYQYIGIAHVDCPTNQQGSLNVTVEFFIGQPL